MIKVITHTATEYRFTGEAEEKIRKHSEELDTFLEDAVYDLIDLGELDLELDSGYENTDEPEIVEATEM